MSVNGFTVLDIPFKAGKIKNHLLDWKQITSDRVILNLVQGCIIEFDNIPIQNKPPLPCKFSKIEEIAVENEIEMLLNKEVIVPSEHEQHEFVSNIFLRPKKNNTFRMILNLKQLNNFVVYKHFKMDTLQSCISLVSQDCFMGSVDLTDAYYSVPVHKDYQKYLKFLHNDKLYQFTCMPNGLSSAPRYFTKLLKPVLATLRSQGFASCSYLDDILLLGNTYQECHHNIQATLQLLFTLATERCYHGGELTRCFV